MNNFEWIKSLNKEEMARWIANQECINVCAYSNEDRDCIEEDYPCFQGVLAWLDMEVDEQSRLEKKDNIENYADLFISHIIEDIKDVKSDYKQIVRHVAEKMLEEIK